MARYRKIDPRIWNDERFVSFTDDGQLAFLFILTHPSMTSLGAMRATIPGLAAEKGWPVQRFMDAISDAMSHGMLVANGGACFFGVKNFLRYNEPEGPNSVSKAWVEALDLIPECPEKRDLMRRARKYLDQRSQEFKEKLNPAIWNVFAMSDAILVPMPDPGAGAGAGTVSGTGARPGAETVVRVLPDKGGNSSPEHCLRTEQEKSEKNGAAKKKHEDSATTKHPWRRDGI